MRLVGNGSNRDGIGARVVVRDGPLEASRVVRSAASFASQSEMTLTFGLGRASGDDRAPVDVEVTWPGGTTRIYPGLEPRRLHVLEEPSLSSRSDAPGSVRRATH